MSQDKAAYYALISENKTASIQIDKQLDNPPVLVTVKSTSHIQVGKGTVSKKL